MSTAGVDRRLACELRHDKGPDLQDFIVTIIFVVGACIANALLVADFFGPRTTATMLASEPVQVMVVAALVVAIAAGTPALITNLQARGEERPHYEAGHTTVPDQMSSVNQENLFASEGASTHVAVQPHANAGFLLHAFRGWLPS